MAAIDVGQMFSGRGGFSFRQEFFTLPNLEPVDVFNGPPPGQLISLSRANETTHRNVISLMLGSAPTNDTDNCLFWDAVVQYDACAVVTADFIGGENIDAVENAHRRLYLPNSFSGQHHEHHEYQHFHWDSLKIKNKNISVWSFTGWPTTTCKRLVPIVPHNFLDFIRALLQQNYKQIKAGKPLLIIGGTLDLPALVAAVLLLIHQACQEARVDVFKCVSYLRNLCGCNVVSSFPHYQFIYDCLLQIMSATPTILGDAADFAYMFQHLTTRPQGDLFGQDVNRFVDMGANRSVAPIKVQYAVLRKLSQLYHHRLFPKRTSSELSPNSAPKPTKRHQFAPKLAHNIWHSMLPSFLHRHQFMAIRGPVVIDSLLRLMRDRGSRTLLWISETANANDILSSCGNSHRGKISLGPVDNYGSFCTFKMSTPISSKHPQPWSVTVFHFAGWPIASGAKPTIPNQAFLHLLRTVVHHAESISHQRTVGDHPIGSHVVTVLESDKAAINVQQQLVGTGCCKTRQVKYSLVEGATWRGVMAGLIVYLDQRMSILGEIDIYRTAQMFKMFDPFRVVISTRQYVWCFKMAWEACLLKQQRQQQHDERYVNSENDVDASEALMSARSQPTISSVQQQPVYLRPPATAHPNKGRRQRRPWNKRNKRDPAKNQTTGPASPPQQQHPTGCCCPCCCFKTQHIYQKRNGENSNLNTPRSINTVGTTSADR